MVVGASVPEQLLHLRDVDLGLEQPRRFVATSAKVSVARDELGVVGRQRASRSANRIFWPGTAALRSAIVFDVLLSL